MPSPGASWWSRRAASRGWPEPGRAALLRRATSVPLVRGASALLCLLVGPGVRAAEASSESWAIEHVRILSSASAPAIENGTVVVRGRVIAALGPTAAVKIPASARRISGDGGTVLPGFWNVHVHFTDDRFQDAAHRPAESLSQACREMLTSRGFTTVVDIGSFPENTGRLVRRSASLDCPRILTSGLPMYPVDGVPIYVRKALGEQLASTLPQPKTAVAAARIVQTNVRFGARAVKLFVGTWLGNRRTGLMNVEVARGAAAEAHRHGLVVFAHPESAEGIEVAIQSGVDVLAHTAPGDGPWSPELVKRLIERHLGLAPTLSLWPVEAERGGVPEDVRKRFIAAGEAQLRDFAAAGGEVLFGTDVGYIPEKDADEEVGRMAGAGMDWRAVLTSLTTAPAWRMNDRQRGALRVGGPADLVLADGDPSADVQALTRVRATWVAGRSVFTR
jgi:imidazolonepropionase-like amidohydrolase